MGLTGIVLHDPRDEVQDVTEIVRAGVDDVDDIETADAFTGCNLRGIDGRSRLVNVNDFVNFLFMRDGDFDNSGRSELQVRLVESVKAFLFDTKMIFPSCEVRELTASALVGFTPSSWL